MMPALVLNGEALALALLVGSCVVGLAWCLSPDTKSREQMQRELRRRRKKSKFAMFQRRITR